MRRCTRKSLQPLGRLELQGRIVMSFLRGRPIMRDGELPLGPAGLFGAGASPHPAAPRVDRSRRVVGVQGSSLNNRQSNRSAEHRRVQ